MTAELHCRRESCESFVLCYKKFKLKEDNHSINSKRHLKTEPKIEYGHVCSISVEGVSEHIS